MKTKFILFTVAIISLQACDNKSKLKEEFTDADSVTVEQVYAYLPYDTAVLETLSQDTSAFEDIYGLKDNKPICTKMRGVKPKVKLTFGKLTLFFKNENPSGIEGFELSVDAINQTMANFMAFDDLMYSNCLLLDAERNRPNPNYPYLIELMKYQNIAFRNFLRFSNSLSSTTSEEEVKEAVKKSEEDYERLNDPAVKPNAENSPA